MPPGRPACNQAFPLGKITMQRFFSRPAERNNTLLSSFARNLNHPRIKIKVPDIAGYQFGNPHTGCIEQFHYGLVAQGKLLFPGRIKKTKDLIHGQKRRNIANQSRVGNTLERIFFDFPLHLEVSEKGSERRQLAGNRCAAILPMQGSDKTTQGLCLPRIRGVPLTAEAIQFFDIGEIGVNRSWRVATLYTQPIIKCIENMGHEKEPLKAI